MSFALGQGGSTRKKIAKASGCVLEYVGNFAYMVRREHELKAAEAIADCRWTSACPSATVKR